MRMALPVLIAARNPAKTAQMRELLSGLDLELTDSAAAGDMFETSEEGQSHLANAIEMAVAESRHTGGVAAVSDGGLSIPALGDGWSSLITRRGTGKDIPDEELARRLLRRMRDVAGERRVCHWTESVAVAKSGELIGAWEANGLRGYIAHDYVPPEGGTNGFWVSGLWVTQSRKRRWQLSGADLEALGNPWGALREPVRDLLSRLGEADSSGAPHH